MSFGAKGSHGIPIDRVREMAARGFTEPEMIDILRNEGYSAEQIDRALTLALRAGVTEPRYGERRIPKPEESESRVPTYGEILERSQPPPSLKPFRQLSYLFIRLVDPLVHFGIILRLIVLRIIFSRSL